MYANPVKIGEPHHMVDCDADGCSQTRPAPIAGPWVSLTAHDLAGAEPLILDFCGLPCLRAWLRGDNPG